MAYAYREERQVLEGGGAVGIGAVLHEKGDLLGDQVVVIVSGGNVDMEKFTNIVGTQSKV